nr:S8 family serine peptidase [Paracoccaceae bacterium]
MFRIFSVIFSLFFSFTIIGQGVLSSELQAVIADANPNDFISIRIEFKENVDCYYLNNEFKENEISVDERPKIVIEQLQGQAEISQTEIVEYIESHYKHSYRNLKQFWVVNIIIMEAKADLINFLNSQSSIALLDFENDKIVMHDTFKINSVNSEKTPGGVENGLQAINAPAMWALGYTGRGRIVYDYDTGVWPNHPAFSSRYMGNFFPTSQSWFPWASSEPNGVISDHGTHTLGTIAGLDTTTKDTIGVAFKSYWIANDYVNATVGTLPPIADMILAFEWALNPDGDVTTTSDIPDVISNSWRWYDDADTVQCGGYVVNLM